ncbi:SPOR domain-containing protein [Ornithinibacillus massiliensis]|uniref:SPOR domain-containing protein n=1 Tax=Ornithinibacillus massiliensis TaxID=1944633 RepID=A0ABS5MBF9_9BACI|nr:SPOR domain-containing protein [Ornithinibacillus massiliensis]MBS3679447.1 SPOR domain-containing protein [Ornithinibacillus massiliensis]
MSAKKQVVVRLDGKGKRENTNKSGHIHVNKKNVSEEIAATEESSHNQIHTFARNYDTSTISSSTAKKQTTFHMFKPIIIAIISALTIGSIMGFVLLKIIVNFDNNLNGTPAVAMPIEGEEKGKDDNQGNASKVDTSHYMLDSMSAFVLQGGVFSSIANAEAESGKFVEQGYAPVIWEKDNQFYLLVTMRRSKEDLQSDINSLKEKGIEVYAKDWQTSEKEVALTKEEYDWVVSFQEQWNLSLENGSLDEETWNALIEQAPKGSTELNSFVTQMEELLTSKENTEIVLLNLWNSLDSVVSTGQ